MVKAALAKEKRFFYTFIKKESRQRRHSGMCGGADADAGEKIGEKADMSTNFWELLHQRQDELTKSGRMVADYLIQHAEEAQYLAI